MSKSTHPLVQLLVMLAIALGLMLVSSIITAPILLLGGGTSSPTALLWTQAITSVLTFAVPVVLMTIIYYRGRQREFYRFDFGGQKWLYGLVGVAALLLLMPLGEWLTEWNDSWNLGRVGELLRSFQDQTEGILETILGATTVGGLLANLVVVALIPAVCEELFFRAGVQNLLQRWLRSPHAAIWLSALIFSLAHGELFSFMPRFVIGALLGYLYVYSRSMLPNMIVHFVNNAIVVVLYWLVARGVLDIDPEAPMNFGWPLTVSCTIAGVAVMWVTFFKKSDSKEVKK